MPSVLVVVTPEADVALWAAEPMQIGPGSTVRACVFGPDEVPRVTQESAAGVSAELAVLSAIAHGNEPDGLDTVLVAIGALSHVERGRARCYTGAIYGALGSAARRALEEIMQRSQELTATADLFEQRLVAAIRAESEARGEARALLRLLDARAIALSENQRARVNACTDLAQLERWIVRAATAGAASDVFEE